MSDLDKKEGNIKTFSSLKEGSRKGGGNKPPATPRPDISEIIIKSKPKVENKGKNK